MRRGVGKVGWFLFAATAALGCHSLAKADTVKDLSDGRFELAQMSVPGSPHSGPPSVVRYPVGTGNPCLNEHLSVSFDGNDPQCSNQVKYGNYAAIPGLTIGTGTLSGTGATYTTGEDLVGKMIYFASGVSRVTNAGLTVEPAVTAINLNSNDLANSGNYFTYQGSTAATTDTTGRDGLNSAFKMTASGQYTNVHHNVAATVSGSTQYTMSADCKMGTVSACTLFPTDSTGSAHAVVNLTATGCTLGEVNGYLFTNVTATAIEKNNGWCHATITFTTLAGSTALQDQFWVGDSTTGIDYTPGYVYIQNVQINAGGPASYIPVAGAAVTKSADTLTVTCPAGCTGDFGGVVFGNHQNSYQAFTAGTLNLISPAGAWSGFPIGRIYATVDQPTPQPAVGAGYLTKTFGTSCFSAATVDMAGTQPAGKDWYLTNFSGYGAGSSANSSLPGDCTLRVGQGTNSFNATFSTAFSAPGGVGFRGKAFGGGFYTEAVLKLSTGADFSATGSDSQQNGWPSWWATSVRMASCLPEAHWPGQTPNYISSPCNVGYTNYLEFDFMEKFPTALFGTGVLSYESSNIHWYDVCCAVQSLANKEVKAFVDGADATKYHTYGWLWIPATDSLPGISTYTYDGVVTYSVSFTKWTGQTPPPSASTPWRYGLSDELFNLILGSGYNATLNPTSPYMIMKSVTVWQLDSTKNRYVQ